MLWQGFGRWGAFAEAPGAPASSIDSIIAGSPTHAVDTGITPTNPAHASGDTLLCVVATRDNSGSLACATSGWANATGYSQGSAFNAGKLYLFMNECDGSSESNPVVTVSAGSPDVVMGAVLRIRGRTFGSAFTLGTRAFNAAATNSIPFPNDSPTIEPGNAILAIGVKNFVGGGDDAVLISGINAGLTWAQLIEHNTLDGDDLALAVDYAINDTASNYTAGTSGVISGYLQNDTSGSAYLEITAS